MSKLSDIVGHDSLRERLSAALEQDRLPHGLLFAGPEGVGKRATADALAQLFLNVAEGRDLSQHPDYHFVDRKVVRLHDKTGKSKALFLTVEAIRGEVVTPANRKSVEGVGKVFVIDEAETMNPAAQNALLKTLEEPAGRTMIVLVTDQPDRLLPTIRSRCQLFRFGRLDESEATTVLERHGIDAKPAAAALQLAPGQPGLAKQLLEDGVAARAGKLAGLLGSHQLGDFLKESAEEYATKQIEKDPLGSKDAATRAGFRLYLRLAAAIYRKRLVDAPSEMICARIDALAQTERYLNANVNSDLALRELELALSA